MNNNIISLAEVRAERTDWEANMNRAYNAVIGIYFEAGLSRRDFRMVLREAAYELRDFHSDPDDAA